MQPFQGIVNGTSQNWQPFQGRRISRMPRTTVEVMLIKQQSDGHTQCRWISTAIMLADCLTKPMDASFLRTVLHLGRFRIFDEDQTLKNNTHKKMASRWMTKQDEGTSKKEKTPV